MSRNLFLRIIDAIKDHNTYFEQRIDARGRFELSTLQKITAMFRMLAYGLPADATDEYVKIGESTIIESMKRFCRATVEVFGERYLRSPTPNDVARLLHIGEQRGFPGIRSGSLTIILEVVADYDLWIWHAYFGLPTTNNDINVLESSHLFFNLASGLSRFWRKEVLHDIMTTCIILHNMIIEDERDFNAPIQDVVEAPTPTIEMVVDENLQFEQFLARHKKIKDKNAHFELRNALIEHLWEQRNNFEN
ncbi:hypothetical protein R3W88_026444 [Solanum pinnatisectum]|uniref:Uncharacterized protein n=1 Tax=Solanum pinnatisectum TaxID=50273 RepID=A0AAV9LGL9_9SOLN|nr:hypothetical protein R3W88_026444 [Solanum pinnatisectum]